LTDGVIVVFRKEDVEKRVCDMAIKEFLIREPLTYNDPKDYYEELDYANESGVVTVRLPDTYISAVGQLIEWLKKGKMWIHGGSTGLVYRKIMKHGAIILSENEYIREFEKLYYERLRFQEMILYKDSRYYKPNMLRLFEYVLYQLGAISEILNGIFAIRGSTYNKTNKVSFRPYPKWYSVLAKYGYYLNTSSYTMIRLAIACSLSTVADIDPNIDTINSTLREMFDSYLSHHEQLRDAYKDITGDEL